MHINLRGFSVLNVFCDLITNLYGDKKMINDNNNNEEIISNKIEDEALANPGWFFSDSIEVTPYNRRGGESVQ